MIKRNPRSNKQGLFGFFSTFFDTSSPKSTPVSRPPRVSLNRLHAVSFDMETPSKKSGLGVANISRTGIGFLAGHSQWPHSGDSVQGTLNILGYKLPTTLRIVHVTSVVVGCQFTVIGQEYSEILSQYFDAELDAIQLLKVNPEYLKKTPNGTALWFKGLDNSELYFIHHENRLTSFVITFLGNTISWSESSKSPQYGILHNSEGEDTPIHSQSNDQSSSLYNPTEMNTTAIKFIHNIKGLSRGFTDQIESILIKSVTDETHENI